jgi:DNA-binding SARP family transcriptional activator
MTSTADQRPRDGCLTIAVLGPLTVWTADGQEVTPTATKPRQLLALLAVRAPGLVTLPAIYEELWSVCPPRSARTTVQTYVVHLRRILEHGDGREGAAATKAVLCTRPGGYALAVEADSLDHRRFDELRRAGEDAFARGDFELAERTLTDALDSWRGSPLADVPHGALLRAEVARLQQNHLCARGLHIEAQLRLGKHHRVLGELTALTVAHPTREDFCHQLMTALYRCGRRSEALYEYRELRQRLHDELGLEPSGRLQALHTAILREDPALDPPAGMRSPYGLARANGR